MMNRRQLLCTSEIGCEVLYDKPFLVDMLILEACHCIINENLVDEDVWEEYIMKVWVLGEIIDEPDKEESTTWTLWGIFLTKEEALRLFGRMRPSHPEKFFIVPIHTGGLFLEDVVNVSGFERMGSNA